MNIIITGASRGIGYETAKLLSAEHTVVVIARNTSNLLKLQKAGNSKNIFPITFDFETGEIQSELLPEINKYVSFVDVLINNAALLINKPFEQITSEEFKKVYKVNVFAIAELTKCILPLMHSSSVPERIGERCHVLNITSMGAVQGSTKFPGLSAYSSSKGAIITLTECLAEEYKEKNISFNAIAFGSVQTEMLSEAFPNFKASLTAKKAAEFVVQFAVTGQKYFNGKTLQMALSTP